MRKTKEPVEETEETPVRSYNICHDCDTTGLVGPVGQETLCPRCLGKGKIE